MIEAVFSKGTHHGEGQRHTPEQIISKLREAEVKLAKGTALAQQGQRN